ncbi:hypothetical protein [Rheinheimera sp. WS51]|uniref:hypothetical protein n=1 Tax=Rheinheimera sp. WS51 TaxID=3425886 RepID=UPI003D8A0CF9
MKFYLIILVIISTQVTYAESLTKVQLDDTKICYPSSFSPDSSFMKAFLAPIADELDSSDGQELIYIPAQNIKAKVSGYTLSHIKNNGVNFEHELTGLAYASSQIGNPNGMAEAAWNVYDRTDTVYVEKDPNLPFYRVYEYHKPLFMWHLVRSEPLKNPSKAIPADWYIGHCSESAGSFSCKQTINFESIFYEYELQAHDLHLRSEVSETVKSLFKEWKQNCKKN